MNKISTSKQNVTTEYDLNQEFLEKLADLHKSKSQKSDAPYIKGGKALKKIRRLLGITQEEFARLFNTPCATYGNWERGDHRPLLHSILVMQLSLPKEYANMINKKDFGYGD